MESSRHPFLFFYIKLERNFPNHSSTRYDHFSNNQVTIGTKQLTENTLNFLLEVELWVTHLVRFKLALKLQQSQAHVIVLT